MRISSIYLFFFLAVAMATTAAYAETKARNVFHDTKNGFSFEYPNDFRRADCAPCKYADVDNMECIGFINDSPQKDGETVDCSFYVQLGSGSVQKVASEHVLFVKTADGWIKHGRFDSSPAKEIKGGVLKGIIAGTSCGISDSEGNFHAAGGQIEGPIGDSPWGSYFGCFRDKYGIEWMVVFDPKYSGKI